MPILDDVFLNSKTCYIFWKIKDELKTSLSLVALLLICPFMRHKWMSQPKINRHLVL